MDVGIDEVGRGSWAGPLLVVAAKANSKLPLGLKDSKRLTKIQRLNFYRLLVGVCNFGEGWVSAHEIDRRGLSKALNLGARRALKQLKVAEGDKIILDGVHNYLPKDYTNVIYYARADITQPIVSAASIYAKVIRDNYMVGLSKKHRGYHFESNVGYGTKVHREAIASLGPINKIHRTSFKPIRELSS